MDDFIPAGSCVIALNPYEVVENEQGLHERLFPGGISRNEET